MQNDNIEGSGAVYVQTNEPDNQVIAFVRGSDGVLSEGGRHATGGKGDGMPHLTSQGSVILTRDGRHLLVANAASDDVSVFAVADGWARRSSAGRRRAVPRRRASPSTTASSTSSTPATPAIERLPHRGGDGLAIVVGSERTLSTKNADPAQVGFSPDGRTLVVTERGTDSIVSFAVGADGTLGMADDRSPSSGPTPYGFAFTDGRHARRDRGVPRGEGRGGRFALHRPRRDR